MFDFKKLISSKYLFEIDTVLMHRSDHLFLIIGIALTAIGIVALLTGRFSSNQFSRKLWYRLSTLTLTIGILEMLWFGFRFEHIRGFGSHFAALAVLLVGVLWLIPIVKYRLTKYRTEIQSWKKEELKQKYLQMGK